MNVKSWLFLIPLICLLPFVLEAHRTGSYSGNYTEGHPILKSFYLDSEEPAIQKTEEGAKFYSPPPCAYCTQCNRKHWCPYCGYCPLYDETDIIDEYDRHASWPTKREDTWMRELGH